VVLGAEVGPPQRRGQRQPQHGGQGQRDGHRVPFGADPDVHHRLAQHDDDQRAVPLGEVRGLDVEPPAHREHERRQYLHDQRAAHSPYAAPPLTIPAVITSSAATRLNGTIRAMFLFTRWYSQACTTTTIREPMPSATPSRPNAFGMASP